MIPLYPLFRGFPLFLWLEENKVTLKYERSLQMAHKQQIECDVSALKCDRGI